MVRVMASLPLLSWLVIVGLSGAAILAALNAIAARLNRDIALHDLRVEMRRLRNAQEARLDRIRRGEG